MAEMRDNRYGYDVGGDAGWKDKICGMTDMAKWIERIVTEWANINREQLLNRGRIVAPIT